MAGETVITVVGNLVDDPELRFTPSGAAVANFRIASTPRTFDRQTNEWKDGEALFLSCSVWRQAAENVAESLPAGHARRRPGPAQARTYETREGEKRTVFELDVEEVGPEPEVRHRQGHRASTRSGGGGGYGGGGQQAGGGGRPVGHPGRRPGGSRAAGGGPGQRRLAGRPARRAAAPQGGQQRDPWAGGSATSPRSDPAPPTTATINQPTPIPAADGRALSRGAPQWPRQ